MEPESGIYSVPSSRRQKKGRGKKRTVAIFRKTVVSGLKSFCKTTHYALFRFPCGDFMCRYNNGKG